jgi:hypothetical protein
MFVAQQPGHPRLLDNGLKQPPSNIRLDQPIPVLAECGVILHWLIHRQTYKPAKQ